VREASNSDTIPFGLIIKFFPESRRRTSAASCSSNEGIERQEKNAQLARGFKPIRTFWMDEWGSENPQFITKKPKKAELCLQQTLPRKMLR
jgi:hypothetical protein